MAQQKMGELREKIASLDKERAELLERLKDSQGSYYKEGLITALTEGVCTICGNEFDGTFHDGIRTYKCDCPQANVVHTECLKRDFRCTCGKTIPPVFVTQLYKDSDSESVS